MIDGDDECSLIFSASVGIFFTLGDGAGVAFLFSTLGSAAGLIDVDGGG